jgi:hypothetical protein
MKSSRTGLSHTEADERRTGFTLTHATQTASIVVEPSNANSALWTRRALTTKRWIQPRSMSSAYDDPRGNLVTYLHGRDGFTAVLTDGVGKQHALQQTLAAVTNQIACGGACVPLQQDGASGTRR